MESADGILIQIKKADFTVTGEQPDSIQRLPGYEIAIAIPDWDKNRLDENNRFVLNRAGLSDDEKLLFSSSVTGRMNVKVWRIQI